jgi:hypothetical protein
MTPVWNFVYRVIFKVYKKYITGAFQLIRDKKKRGTIVTASTIENL